MTTMTSGRTRDMDTRGMEMRGTLQAPIRGVPSRKDDRGRATTSLTRMLSRHGSGDAAAATLRDDSTGVLGFVLIVLAMLGVVIVPAITTATVVPILGGIAAIIALAALASLVHLIATDVRDAWRGRGRPNHEAPAGDAHLSAAARAAA